MFLVGSVAGHTLQDAIAATTKASGRYKPQSHARQTQTEAAAAAAAAAYKHTPSTVGKAGRHTLIFLYHE